MIFTLSGTITEKGEGYAVVEAGGVGYQAYVHKGAVGGLKVGAAVKMWTHEYLREDARELYGFLTKAEHALFLRLLAISGVGPKMALNILSLGPVRDIEKKIEDADVAWLTRVPGIGKKTAQKIVLELKGKLAAADGGSADEEVLTALVNLGYHRERAREALAHASGESVEDRLKGALRQLGR